MLDAIRSRRSIRHYTSEPLDDEILAQLKDAVLRSPSSRNLQPWHFVFVTDPGLLTALSQAKPAWGAFLAKAALGVVVCADSSVSDCWIEDGSIAATVLQLAAADLGLGSCWIQIRDRQHADGRPSEEYVRELLDLPSAERVLCILSVGYPAETKPSKSEDSLPWTKVSTRDAQS